MSKIKILIIGGGPASVSTCIQILKEHRNQNILQPIEIHVFEKTDKVGPGLPYSKKDDCYILNLPKDIMEPVYGNNGEFSKWLKTVPEAPQNTDFPPRHYFGKYLELMAQKVKLDAFSDGVTIKYHTKNEVCSVDCDLNGVTVITDKEKSSGDYLVLCTGHMPSSTYREFVGLSGYYHNPWDESLYKELNPTEDVCIIGTRLTAIDAVRKLLSSGHKGKVRMASRGGMLPTVLSKEIPPYPLKHLTLSNLDLITKSGLENLPLEKLAELCFLEINEAEGRNVIPNELILSYKQMSAEEWLIKQISMAESGPKPWQQVLFSAYPIVPNIWSMLSLKDKKIFVKYYKSSFLTYLAAFPLENAYKLKKYIKSGQLEVLGGLTDITHASEQGFRVEFIDRPPIFTKLLINGTGPGYNAKSDKLYKSMIDKRIIFPHEVGGIQVDPISLRATSPYNRIFAVGEITWGDCLATTDMTRVAIQSGRVALSLTRDIANNNKPFNRRPIHHHYQPSENMMFCKSNFTHSNASFFRKPNNPTKGALLGAMASSVITAGYLAYQKFSK